MHKHCLLQLIFTFIIILTCAEKVPMCCILYKLNFYIEKNVIIYFVHFQPNSDSYLFIVLVKNVVLFLTAYFCGASVVSSQTKRFVTVKVGDYHNFYNLFQEAVLYAFS